MGTGSGELIDSKFDVVIRTNDSVALDEEYETDYGSKTTIAYWNNFFIRRHITKGGDMKKLLDLLVRKNIRFIIVKGDKTAKALNMLARQRPDCKTVFLRTAYAFKDRPEFWLKSTDAEGYMELYEPTLISFILSDVFLYPPQVVYVTGVNFYSSSKHWADFYNQDVNQRQQTISRNKLHHVLGDKAYLRYLCRIYSSQLKLDPVLANIMAQS